MTDQQFKEVNKRLKAIETNTRITWVILVIVIVAALIAAAAIRNQVLM